MQDVIFEKVQNWLAIMAITMLSACVGLCAGNDVKHHADTIKASWCSRG